MFPVFNPTKRLIRKTDLLRKFRIGKITPFFTQEDCQLLVEISAHRQNMANLPPSMCGDFKVFSLTTF